jgi:hypothetical protein
MCWSKATNGRIWRPLILRRLLGPPAAEYFKNLGATRVTECWGDDVPRGEVIDFFRAMQGEGRRSRRLQLDRVSGQGDPRRPPMRR